MNTKIISTIQEWVPESEKWIGDLLQNQHRQTMSDYLVLKKMADVCIEKIRSSNEVDLEIANDIVKVISMLYQSGNQYVRNAIENEFLTELSIDESPSSLKKHLAFLPAELRKEYIKTIIEN